MILFLSRSLGTSAKLTLSADLNRSCYEVLLPAVMAVFESPATEPQMAVTPAITNA